MFKAEDRSPGMFKAGGRSLSMFQAEDRLLKMFKADDRSMVTVATLSSALEISDTWEACDTVPSKQRNDNAQTFP